jgi:hypothetical protein
VAQNEPLPWTQQDEQKLLEMVPLMNDATTMRRAGAETIGLDESQRLIKE